MGDTDRALARPVILGALSRKESTSSWVLVIKYELETRLRDVETSCQVRPHYQPAIGIAVLWLKPLLFCALWCACEVPICGQKRISDEVEHAVGRSQFAIHEQSVWRFVVAAQLQRLLAIEGAIFFHPGQKPLQAMAVHLSTWRR